MYQLSYKKSILLIMSWAFIFLLTTPIKADNSQMQGSALLATITVTTTADELNADGDCSLREAIQAANTDAAVDACAAGAGADVIDLAALTYNISSYVYEDANASGDFDITSDITINGNGATIRRNGAVDDYSRIIEVHPGATAVINDVTINNGRTHTINGAGLANGGDLTLNNSFITGNVGGPTGGPDGGGIYNYGGNLVMNNGAIYSNSAWDAGGVLISSGTVSIYGVDIYSNGSTGGSGNDGLGITMSNGDLLLEGSTLRNHNNGSCSSGNGRGAALFMQNSATATIRNSTVHNNWSGCHGGAIFFQASALTIENSTFNNNHTEYSGGAIYQNAGTMTITNSTFSSNDASGPGNNNGGAIYIGNGTSDIKNSTITANYSEGAGAVYRFWTAGVVSLGNNIISGNTGAAPQDCEAATPSNFTNAGFNVGCFNGLSGNVGPLQDNGGSTWTHMPNYNSDAIMGGDCSGSTVLVDQRGIGRPLGSACDAGAVEVVDPLCVTYLDGTGASYFSEDESALQVAVDLAAPNELIKVYGTCTGVNNRASDVQTVYISKTLTLQGGYGWDNWSLYDPLTNVTVLDANNLGRAVTVPAGTTATLQGFTMQNGNHPATGGLLLNGGDLSVLDANMQNSVSGVGGGMTNLATAYIENSTFDNLSSAWGGAILNSGAAAQLTLNRSVIINSMTANDGGAILNEFGAGLTMQNSTVSGNTSANNGGGIHTRGGTTTNLQNVTIAFNDAPAGANLFNEAGAAVNLIDTIVSDAVTGANCFGAVTSLGYNLEDTNVCGLGQPTDQPSQPANLGVLATNSGNKLSHRPGTGSIALENGSCTGNILLVDQRGFTRPQGIACDIGAIEVDANSAIIVNTIDDELNSDGDCSLREAVESANTDTAVDFCIPGFQDDTIQFDPAIAGQTINLSMVGNTVFGSSALMVNTIIHIDGQDNNITIDRDDAAGSLRLFYVDPVGDLTLSNLTLQDGLAQGGKGGDGINMGGGAAGLGGAIVNDQGALTIDNVTFSANQALGGYSGNNSGSSSSASGGGGGGGLGANGGNQPGGHNGGAGGGPNGGAGGPINGNGTPGGFGGGGGGGGGQCCNGGSGAAGGFGGGGGAGGYEEPGANGGFGGGGGAGWNPGNGGFLGGNGGYGATSGYAGGGGGAGMGSAIFNYQGAITVTATSFTGNTARGGNGGTPANSSGNGGAGGSAGGAAGTIYNYNGTLMVSQSTFNNNSLAGGLGGNNSQSGFTPGRGGDAYGGGIFNHLGTATVVNTTFSNNSLAGGRGGNTFCCSGTAGTGGNAWGGGLINWDGTVSVTNSTLAEHGLTPGAVGGGCCAGGGSVSGGAVYNVGGAALMRLSNNILANSTGANDAANNGGVITGTLNLIESSSGVPAAAILTTADPMLGPLQDNGGATWSHDLVTASPAEDTGDCDGGTVAVDQRGIARFIGTACDLGAVEFDNTAITDVTISGPMIGSLNSFYTFTADIIPATAAFPITYTWQADGQTPVVNVTNALSDTVSFSWPLGISKNITVTANNITLNGVEGWAMDAHVIVIEQAVLEIGKTAVYANNILTYTITVTNSGNITGNVTLTDDLPAGMSCTATQTLAGYSTTEQLLGFFYPTQPNCRTPNTINTLNYQDVAGQTPLDCTIPVAVDALVTNYRLRYSFDPTGSSWSSESNRVDARSPLGTLDIFTGLGGVNDGNPRTYNSPFRTTFNGQQAMGDWHFYAHDTGYTPSGHSLIAGNSFLEINGYPYSLVATPIVAQDLNVGANHILEPSNVLEYTCSGSAGVEFSKTAATPAIEAGSDMTFTLTVTNTTGSSINGSINDPLVAACDMSMLFPAGVSSYECVDVAVAASYTNTAVFSATFDVNNVAYVTAPEDPTTPINDFATLTDLNLMLTGTAAVNVCNLPGAVPTVNVSINVNDIVLDWVVAPDATSYEVWYTTNDPYFVAGNSCASPPVGQSCVAVAGTSWTHVGGNGNPASNYYYRVLGINSCSAGPVLENQHKAQFDFTVVPGS